MSTPAFTDELYTEILRNSNLPEFRTSGNRFRAVAEAAFAAGAASVPREPTIAMIQAGCEAFIECKSSESRYVVTGGRDSCKGPEHIWRAMHDAATGGK